MLFFNLFKSVSAEDEMTTALASRQRPPIPPNRHTNRQEDLFLASTLRQKYKTVLRPTTPDVSVVFSSSCQVSGEWATYISGLMKRHGYPNVVLQDVESLAQKQGELPMTHSSATIGRHTLASVLYKKTD